MKHFKVLSPDLWNQIHDLFGNSGGVYKLHCLREPDDESFVPTNRLLGVDPEGVLYIGKASTFATRVIDLKKSLHPDYESSNHHVGLRFERYDALKRAFKIEHLCMTLHESIEPAEAEHKELDEYAQRFGELPPLNAMS